MIIESDFQQDFMANLWGIYHVLALGHDLGAYNEARKKSDFERAQRKVRDIDYHMKEAVKNGASYNGTIDQEMFVFLLDFDLKHDKGEISDEEHRRKYAEIEGK